MSADLNTEMIRRNMESILELDDRIDGYTTKADCRPTGVSIHFKFGRKADINAAVQFAGLIEKGPGLLVNAMRLLLGEEQVVGE